MNFLLICTYGKNLSTNVLEISQPLIEIKCLYPGSLMKESKSLFIHSRRFVNFSLLITFHIFCLKDFARMIYKITLVSREPLVTGVIIPMYFKLATMIMQLKPNIQFIQSLEMYVDHQIISMK